MTTHDTDPTNQLSVYQQLQGQFNEKVWDPSLRADTLEDGQSVELTTPMADQASGAPKVYAILEIPRGEADGEFGYLILGHSENIGYFLASPDTDSQQLAFDISQRRKRSESPLDLGSDIGNKMTVGRSPFVFETPGKEPFQLPDDYAKKVRSAFGQETSRAHAVIEVIPGGVKVTDTSTHGTRVLHKD